VRTDNPLLISVGIHLTLLALAIGAMSVLHKTIPAEPEKIKLKLLIPSAEPEISAPAVAIQPPQPIQKSIEPTPIPKAIEPRVVTPPAPRIITQSKPIIPNVQPTIAAPVAAKAPEAVPVAAPKAPPPPPPKAQENYEEENLGRIRTILAERLKYPKNALRLKQQGEAIVTFTLGTDRSVSQITITKSSEFELLDDAARGLIESSASEFPKPAKSVRISVPIAYKLR